VLLAVVMLGRSGANLVASRRLKGFLRVIVNGEAGLRPSLAAIGWSFVLDTLDYGRPSGSSPRAVGHICRSRSWYSCYSRSRPVARVAHGSSGRCGPPRTPVVDKCRVGPGRADGG
jgi:hypothetical protein